MINLVKEYSKKDNQKIGVYMIDSPMESAYVKIFFKALQKGRDYCLTQGKAYSLLQLKVSYDKFQDLINI